jgi:hypothetical protein
MRTHLKKRNSRDGDDVATFELQHFFYIFSSLTRRSNDLNSVCVSGRISFENEAVMP